MHCNDLQVGLLVEHHIAIVVTLLPVAALSALLPEHGMKDDLYAYTLKATVGLLVVAFLVRTARIHSPLTTTANCLTCTAVLLFWEENPLRHHFCYPTLCCWSKEVAATH